MDNFIEMDFDEWCDTYKPIINHIDSNASFDNGDGGIMFETYGDEVEFVKSQSPANIWICLLYTSPSPRDRQKSRMPSSA